VILPKHCERRSRCHHDSGWYHEIHGWGSYAYWCWRLALGIFGISGHEQIALGLGLIVATIEVVGGISFASGHSKTSRWAAVFLSAVMGVAILFKITHLKPLTGNTFAQAAGLLEQIRLDLLLFAVFFQKALQLIMSCCGMDGCCKMDSEKK